MRLRVRVLRVVRNESKAPGGSNKGVRVWARSKHNLKGPSARKQYRLAARDLPPGGNVARGLFGLFNCVFQLAHSLTNSNPKSRLASLTPYSHLSLKSLTLFSQFLS